MLLEQHIEELRAELRNAVYRDERREIEIALLRVRVMALDTVLFHERRRVCWQRGARE